MGFKLDAARAVLGVAFFGVETTGGCAFVGVDLGVRSAAAAFFGEFCGVVEAVLVTGIDEGRGEFSSEVVLCSADAGLGD